MCFVTSSASTPNAPALFLAAMLVAIEGLAAVIFGIAEAAMTQASRPVIGITTAIVMVSYGLLLLLVARGLKRQRRWSRGPTVATQLLLLPIAWSFVSAATWWVALILAALSVTTLVCVFLPSSTAVFTAGGQQADTGSTEANTDGGH